MITRQLRELADHGIIRRRQLPAPTSAWVYELTPWGALLEPIVISLARWSVSSPEMPERAGLPVSVDSAVLSMRVLFNPDAAAEAAITLSLVVNAESFRVDIRNRSLAIRREQTTNADLHLATDPDSLVALVRGETSIETAHRHGLVTVKNEQLASASRVLGYFGTTHDAS